jgi:predicted nucleotidyltransferase
MKKTDYIDICKSLVLNNLDKQEYAVFLFGSRVNEKHAVKADIDIGILGTQTLPENKKNHLLELIEEADIPYNVDIIDFAAVDDSFRKAALKTIHIWIKPPHISLD